MRAKFINEFVRGGDPLTTLGIGRVAKIQKLFRNLDIPDDDYEIRPENIIFNDELDLESTDVVWLPDNLKINGWLDLSFTDIKELPNNLWIGGNLNLFNAEVVELPNGLHVGLNLTLMDTNITKLPDDLIVRGSIFVDPYQKELIEFIKSSGFANKLKIWK